MKKHAHFVDIEIQHGAKHPGWNITYNDSSFYTRAKSAALQCTRKVAFYTVKLYGLRIHSEKFDRHYYF